MRLLAWKLVLLVFPAALAGCGGSAPPLPGFELIGDDGDALEITARGPADAGYILSTGDAFEVSFLFEPQLSTRVTVRPDGAVALPILGEVTVAGRTPAALDSMLTAAYGTYYRDPEITVNVVQFAPPSVYVLGEVGEPRSVVLQPGMTLLHALAAANGPVPGADLGSVVLIRRLGETRAVARRIDAGGVLNGRRGARDVLLAPYDIIYVPTTFVTQLSRFADQLFGKMTHLPTLYLRGWEVFHTDRVYGRYVYSQPAGGS